MEGKKFTHENAAAAPIELDESFEAYPTPAGFKAGFSLKPHQGVSVAALIDIEDTRVVISDEAALPASAQQYSCDSSSQESSSDDAAGLLWESMYLRMPHAPSKADRPKYKYAVSTSAMVLSEPFGSGKTIMVLALILERPIPRALPRYVAVHRHGIQNTLVETKFGGTIVPTTLIVVGNSVLLQWKDAIERFTNLRCLVVAGHSALVKLAASIDTVGMYDIVLLKNGTCSGECPGSLGGRPGPPELIRYKNASTLKVMDNIMAIRQPTGGPVVGARRWARAVYDDCDMLPMRPCAVAARASFTVFVSATKPERGRYGDSELIKTLDFDSAVVLLKNYGEEAQMFRYFNVRCKNEYVTRLSALPALRCYNYTLKNPQGAAIGLISAMGGEEDILEMLNGDGHVAAAERLGIASSNAADIFARLLGDKTKDFVALSRTLEAIEGAREALNALVDAAEGKNDESGEGDESELTVEAMRAALTKGKVPKFDTPDPRLIAALNVLEADTAARHSSVSAAVKRVVVHAEEGGCLVCLDSFKDKQSAKDGMTSAIFILRCCGYFICRECAYGGLKFDAGNHSHYGQPAAAPQGTCANCRSTINPRAGDIIAVGLQNLDDALRLDEVTIEELDPSPAGKGKEKVDDDTSEAGSAAHDEDDATAAATAAVGEATAKLKVLLEIINGNKSAHAVTSTAIPPGVLVGGSYVDAPAGTAHKVLVFTGSHGSLEYIKAHLEARSVHFIVLGSRHKAIAQQIVDFRDGGAVVLLINARHNCAGLNLEFATDLVYYHRICDDNIHAQVAGRIQRIGRVCSGNIHRIMYENESAGQE